GTEKYPKENDYNSYLSSNGGYSNAYTDLEDTCYYFEVGSDAFEGALDRFSQFFLTPLFTADCTDREVRAVDSEHKKNMQNDMWRQYQMEKELSNPAHPFNLFATGTYETLKGAAEELGVDLREELLKFHAKYYSADIMKLVVVGRQSLDQLTEWAVSMFSMIESKGLTKPVFKGHPLTSNETGKLLLIKSVREQRALDITFALPDLKPYVNERPGRHLGSLIGHEGPGSILSYLKHRGWATSIVAGRSPTSAEGFDMFKITSSLTEDGMANYKEVIRVIFAYLQLLRSTGPQEWFQKELQRISEIEYRFMEKNDAVTLASSLAAQMQNRFVQPSRILSSMLLVTHYNKDLIKRVTDCLNPDNFRVLIAAREFDVPFNQVEKHYEVAYRVDPLPQDLMDDLHSTLKYDELHLPGPNMFIPDSLDVKKPAGPVEPTREPVLLKLTEGWEVWFKRDDRFFLPRGEIRIIIETPLVYESPLNSLLAQLFTLILKDSLCEITYDAQVAGLWFDIRDSSEGIFVHVDGFNDKLGELLKLLLRSLRTLQVDDTRFDVYSREIKKKLDNAKHSEPYTHIQTSVSFLNQGTMWRYSDKLSAFPLITKERLQHFIDTLFEQVRIQMIMMGNFTEEDAMGTADTITAALDARSLPDYARRVPRSLLHSPGQFVHYQMMPDEGNVNSGVDMSVYAGTSQNLRERALLDLTSLIVTEPYFNQLRTKEQLGYIAYSSDRKYHGGPMALRFLVQSESNPIYVTMRIERFLKNFRQRIVDMTQEDFERYVNSVIVKKEEKLKNLFEETSRFWRHICAGYYEFEKIEHDVATLRTLTRADVLAYWDQYVNKEAAPHFTSLVAQCWSTKIPMPNEHELKHFPAVSIGLFGCMQRYGADEFTVVDADKLVRIVHDEKLSVEDSLAKAKDAYRKISKKSDEEFSKVWEKVAEASSYVRSALEMVLERPLPPVLVNGVGSVYKGLENIGAVHTPDGAWMFEDAAVFKTTLRQSGNPIPTRLLVPKYK
ncbi:metalloprotease, partial [Linderina pennispora]